MILAPTTTSYCRAILYGYSSAIKGGNVITQSVEFGYLCDVRCRHDCIPSSGAATDHLSPPFPPPHSFTPHTITSLTSAKILSHVFLLCCTPVVDYVSETLPPGCGQRGCRQGVPVRRQVGVVGMIGRERTSDEGGRERCDHVCPATLVLEHELTPVGQVM